MPGIFVQKSPDIQKSVAVGTTVVELMPEKTTNERRVWVVTNTSTLNQTITLGIGRDAVAGSGIVLAAGASWVESQDSKFAPANERITAISSAVNGSVSVYERSEAIA